LNVFSGCKRSKGGFKFVQERKNPFQKGALRNSIKKRKGERSVIHDVSKKPARRYYLPDPQEPDFILFREKLVPTEQP
jgi:hypothetical protein